LCYYIVPIECDIGLNYYSMLSTLYFTILYKTIYVVILIINNSV